MLEQKTNTVNTGDQVFTSGLSIEKGWFNPGQRGCVLRINGENKELTVEQFQMLRGYLNTIEQYAQDREIEENSVGLFETALRVDKPVTDSAGNDWDAIKRRALPSLEDRKEALIS